MRLNVLANAFVKYKHASLNLMVVWSDDATQRGQTRAWAGGCQCLLEPGLSFTSNYIEVMTSTLPDQSHQLHSCRKACALNQLHVNVKLTPCRNKHAATRKRYAHSGCLWNRTSEPGLTAADPVRLDLDDESDPDDPFNPDESGRPRQNEDEDHNDYEQRDRGGHSGDMPAPAYQCALCQQDLRAMRYECQDCKLCFWDICRPFHMKNHSLLPVFYIDTPSSNDKKGKARPGSMTRDHSRIETESRGDTESPEDTDSDGSTDADKRTDYDERSSEDDEVIPISSEEECSSIIVPGSKAATSKGKKRATRHGSSPGHSRLESIITIRVPHAKVFQDKVFSVLQLRPGQATLGRKTLNATSPRPSPRPWGTSWTEPHLENPRHWIPRSTEAALGCRTSF